MHSIKITEEGLNHLPENFISLSQVDGNKYFYYDKHQQSLKIGYEWDNILKEDNLGDDFKDIFKGKQPVHSKYVKNTIIKGLSMKFKSKGKNFKKYNAKNQYKIDVSDVVEFNMHMCKDPNIKYPYNIKIPKDNLDTGGINLNNQETFAINVTPKMRQTVRGGMPLFSTVGGMLGVGATGLGTLPNDQT